MNSVICSVEGMKCQGCAQKITNAIVEQDQNAKVSVDLSNKKVEIRSDVLWSLPKAKQVVEGVGFKLISFKKA